MNNMNNEIIVAGLIRELYQPKERKKEKAKVTIHHEIFLYALGILSFMVLTLGLALSMEVILPGSQIAFLAGIILCVISIICCMINPLIAKKISEKNKPIYVAD